MNVFLNICSMVIYSSYIDSSDSIVIPSMCMPNMLGSDMNTNTCTGQDARYTWECVKAIIFSDAISTPLSARMGAEYVAARFVEAFSMKDGASVISLL